MLCDKYRRSALEVADRGIEAMIAKLQNDFPEDSRLYLAKLRALAPKKNQSIFDFASELRDLTNLAYPDSSMRARESICMEQMRQVVPTEIRGQFVSSKTFQMSVADAAELMPVFNDDYDDERASIKKVTIRSQPPPMGKLQRPPPSSPPSSETSSDESSSRRTERRTKRLQQGYRRSPRLANESIRCYRCGGKGHMQNACGSKIVGQANNLNRNRDRQQQERSEQQSTGAAASVQANRITIDSLTSDLIRIETIVSFNSDFRNSSKVQALIDSGCSTSTIRMSGLSKAMQKELTDFRRNPNRANNANIRLKNVAIYTIND
jgi:hypothetical protein